MIVEIVIKAGFLCTAIAAVMGLTGCAVFNPEGFEFGANVGMYAVDQRTSSSQTNENKKPLVCNLIGSLAMCRDQENTGGAVHGS